MPPLTLLRYLSMRTLLAVIALMAALSSLVLIVDLVENLRFIDKFKNGDFGFALRLSLLRTPALAQAMLPFVFLFASIWLFTQLNRRAEIAVMRSAGLSVWKLIFPAALVAALAGLAVIAVVDPAAARLRAESEKLKDAMRGANSSVVRVFGDGIWLRQRDGGNLLIINARGFDAATATLTDVVMWRRDAESNFLERIDAPEAVLSGRTIELRKARIKGSGDRLNHRTPVYAIQTSLSPADLRERLESPETLSVWRLPRFIMLAEAAGLPTTRYNMRFHDLFATPLKLVAMVLIAAMFSLRPVRSGGAFRLFLVAVAAGFLLYVVSEIATAMGESGVVPIALSAWAPAIIATLIALSGLLHFEEG